MLGAKGVDCDGHACCLSSILFHMCWLPRNSGLVMSPSTIRILLQTMTTSQQRHRHRLHRLYRSGIQLLCTFHWPQRCLDWLNDGRRSMQVHSVRFSITCITASSALPPPLDPGTATSAASDASRRGEHTYMLKILSRTTPLAAP